MDTFEDKFRELVNQAVSEFSSNYYETHGVQLSSNQEEIFRAGISLGFTITRLSLAHADPIIMPQHIPDKK